MTQIRWGLIGTGFAATRRAEAIVRDPNAQLVAVAGRHPERTATFCQTVIDGVRCGPEVLPVPLDHWRSLLERDDIDVIAVCTIPSDHAEQVHASLTHDKHTVVEYPLAIDPATACDLLALARSRDRLLHVEHIELLGGLHRTAVDHLPSVGKPYYARYVTLLPKHPAPRRWSYHGAEFGFPFVGALSRVMRMIDLFGAVDRVSASVRYWPQVDRDDPSPSFAAEDYYTSCLCRGVLEFQNGVTADLIYGKGDRVWTMQNQFDVLGDRGALDLEPNQGWLIRNDERCELPIGTRRGMFARDTEMVTATLLKGVPLYMQPEQSLYALEVADALRRSAQQNTPISLDVPMPQMKPAGKTVG
ncbi:MAG: gfo/Idh/MocA family oxidoreductase [Oscillatoriales cyanobacterium]|nr:MAG: gfo/Idh/MocA family oxidoreductase [Oscillatoriales cyanobacterium]